MHNSVRGRYKTSFGLSIIHNVALVCHETSDEYDTFCIATQRLLSILILSRAKLMVSPSTARLMRTNKPKRRTQRSSSEQRLLERVRNRTEPFVSTLSDRFLHFSYIITTPLQLPINPES